MLRLIVALLTMTGLAACQTAFLTFSGGALQGPVADTDSFAFAAQYRLLKLEVKPEHPYSVILRVIVRDGELYIDAADRRRWHTYLKQNSNVRVMLGDTVYLATAIHVEDPEITQQFLARRTIYRLVPRPLAQPQGATTRRNHKAQPQAFHHSATNVEYHYGYVLQTPRSYGSDKFQQAGSSRNYSHIASRAGAD